MKYVAINCSLWQLEDEQYLKLLDTIGAGREFTMLDFGTLILRIDADVSQMNARAAQLLREQLRHEEVKTGGRDANLQFQA